MLVHVVENERTPLDSSTIFLVRVDDAADQPGEPRRLRAVVTVVLAVDVVHDLADCTQGVIANAEASDECLERAVGADVRVFGIVHVESQFARSWLVSSRRDEFESRLPIDESADEPCAGNSIDVYIASR